MSRSLAYGLHPVRSLLEREPAGIARLLLLDPNRPPFAELATLAAAHGITVERRPAGTLDRLCGGAVHQGALALLSAPPQALDENALEAILASAAQPLLLVLDEVQDPRNLGACLRSADAAGVDAVIVPRRNAAGLTPVACRTAVGAAESLAYYEVGNLANLLDQLRERGVWVVGTALEERSESLFAFQAPDALAVVMGAEGAGLKRLTRDKCDQLLEIPMAGEVQSLNVSVATGVMLFHVRAQRESSE
ncbi:MAG TPA: 23S rRNA (guanosine(2251)-2'-O)-methyltransferase RlmB [Gammaproteobacteria bacterium]|nr:23S rRNA (guanosine(2251)-2'-O)-methyltransferase RlmB [Gammaproteobacteria bacterium]